MKIIPLECLALTGCAIVAFICCLIMTDQRQHVREQIAFRQVTVTNVIEVYETNFVVNLPAVVQETNLDGLIIFGVDPVSGGMPFFRNCSTFDCTATSGCSTFVFPKYTRQFFVQFKSRPTPKTDASDQYEIAKQFSQQP